MRKLTCLSILMIGLAFCLFPIGNIQGAEPEEGYVSLFNGKDLSGWSVKGGSATYRVENGSIIGTCVPNTPHNTFLCSEKTFGNFILKLEFKAIIPGNSGVQFRAQCRKEKDMERVFGYQSEIDPSSKNETGRIYDEGRRGFKYKRIWLDDTPIETIKKMQSKFKMTDWNTMEIQCVGPSIRTWINGVAVSNIFDYYDFSGFIGLQIHAGKQGEIAWRNIRIKDLGISEWEPFFVKDGESMKLQNARFILPNEWSFVKEGYLRGIHGKTEKRDGLVVSNKEYDNFVAKVSYQMFGGNSGLYFRAEENDVPWTMRGFQNEISGNFSTSGIWHTQGKAQDGKIIKGRGWLAKNEEFVEKLFVKNDWNTICTIACNNRIMNFLNGFKTVDFLDPLYDQPTGKVGLQLHGGNDSEMWFKDFEIMPITKEMMKLINRSYDPVELTCPVAVKGSDFAKDFEIQGEYITPDNGRGYQIIADGDGKFRVVGYPGGLPGNGWDRSMARFFGTADLQNDRLIVVGQKMNIPKKEKEGENPDIIFNEEQKKRPMAFYKENGKIYFLNKEPQEAEKVLRESPTLGMKPPKDAHIVFDGKNVDQFLPGARMNEAAGTLWSEALSKPFENKPYTMHLEFMLSFMPKSKGQARSNSGVYIAECYECQVLDSFGLEGLDNECGGFYQFSKPLVNMCFPPLTWQTYDIEFTPAKFDQEGKKTANAVVTVLHNGIPIHTDLELPKETPGRKKEANEPRGVYLQGHGNHVQYRNIWVQYK